MGPVQARSQTAREAGLVKRVAQEIWPGARQAPPFKDSAHGGANPKRPTRRDEQRLRSDETTMHMRSAV